MAQEAFLLPAPGCRPRLFQEEGRSVLRGQQTLTGLYWLGGGGGFILACNTRQGRGKQTWAKGLRAAGCILRDHRGHIRVFLPQGSEPRAWPCIPERVHVPPPLPLGRCSPGTTQLGVVPHPGGARSGFSASMSPRQMLAQLEAGRWLPVSYGPATQSTFHL